MRKSGSKDAHDRQAIVAHLRQQLRRGDKSLVGNKGYRRYLKVEGEGHFQIDEAQVKAEARYDGLWVLRTNTAYEAPDRRARLQDLVDGRTELSHGQVDPGNPTHLPPER